MAVIELYILLREECLIDEFIEFITNKKNMIKLK